MNMTGPDSFSNHFAEECSTDQDLITDLLLSIDAISGVSHYFYDGMLIFALTIEDKPCPIVFFSSGQVFIQPETMTTFFKEHNRSTVPAKRFIAKCGAFINVRRKNRFYLDLKRLLDDPEKFTISIYRFVYSTRYEQC